MAAASNLPSGSRIMDGALFAGRYELEELVGVGGMSRVYRARDTELERTVAIKLLHESIAGDPDSVRRFRSEARMAAGLAHEHIVSVIDRGEDDGRLYIVFEYFAGTNLKQLLLEAGRLPPGRALELVLQVADGLVFAHANGYVHRDVKPQNVLVDADGRAKLTDFGIARGADVTGPSTLTGSVLGSADYIAPEQAQAGVVDERSDVYALGVVLYELLTGTCPFTGDNFIAVAMQHIHEAPPPARQRASGIPHRIDAAIERALAKDPRRRFQTMQAFADELRACLAEVGAESAPGDTLVLAPPGLAAGRHGRRRQVGMLASAASVLVGLGILAAVLAFPQKHGGARSPAVRKPAALPAPATPVERLRAAAAYDPSPGDGVEDNLRLPLATDGKPGTAWATEWYATAQFGNLKRGVGIVVDAGSPVLLRAITVRTDTPGFTARVKGASSPHGPFRALSESQRVGARTTFSLATGKPARYYLLWITSLPPGTGPRYRADVNDLTAGRAPTPRRHAG